MLKSFSGIGYRAFSGFQIRVKPGHIAGKKIAGFSTNKKVPPTGGTFFIFKTLKLYFFSIPIAWVFEM